MDIDFGTAEAQSIIIKRCRHATPHDKNCVSPENTVNLVLKLTDTTVVKFGIGVTAAEAYALQFASQNLDTRILKVPRLVQFFTAADGLLWMTGYLVMSFVEGTVLDRVVDADRFVPRLIKAIQHMHFVTSLQPRPLDGGHARGLLWSEYTSGQKLGKT